MRNECPKGGGGCCSGCSGGGCGGGDEAPSMLSVDGVAIRTWWATYGWRLVVDIYESFVNIIKFSLSSYPVVVVGADCVPPGFVNGSAAGEFVLE